MHFEQMKGSFVQNTAHASKEGTLVEIGVKPMQNGKKRKLLEYNNEIDLGKNVLDTAFVLKEGTLVEIGVKPMQNEKKRMQNAKKRKLLELKNEIDLGKKVLDIADSDYFFDTFRWYRHGLIAYSEYKRCKLLRTNRVVPNVGLLVMNM